MNGHSDEDDSTGYTLTKDPEAKKAQLAMRDYALRNEALILNVLASAADPRHRATAGQLCAYFIQELGRSQQGVTPASCTDEAP